MAKKKHAEEHENLERWLVSYADFITLLFATFVVLYALSQVDISGYKALEDSIKQAFAAPSLISGSNGVMDTSGQSILSSGVDATDMAVIPPLLENLSAKYEDNAFKDIKNSVEEALKDSELQDIEANINERGLVITLVDSVVFSSGSATINKDAYPKLIKIGQLLKAKFVDHYIRVEGHTDNIGTHSVQFPSNWELSSARASSVVRFFIDNLSFNKSLFAAVGYADGRPAAANSNEEGRRKNRRVEIIVLRNKLSRTESGGYYRTKFVTNKEEVEKQQQEEVNKYKTISDAAKALAKETKQSIMNVLSLDDSYDKENNKIKQEIKEKEQEKKTEKTIKLPDQKLQKSLNTSADQQSLIEEARQKGQVSDAVAELMRERGDNSDILISDQKKTTNTTNKTAPKETKVEAGHDVTVFH